MTKEHFWVCFFFLSRRGNTKTQTQTNLQTTVDCFAQIMMPVDKNTNTSDRRKDYRLMYHLPQSSHKTNGTVIIFFISSWKSQISCQRPTYHLYPTKRCYIYVLGMQFHTTLVRAGHWDTCMNCQISMYNQTLSLLLTPTSVSDPCIWKCFC